MFKKIEKVVVVLVIAAFVLAACAPAAVEAPAEPVMATEAPVAAATEAVAPAATEVPAQAGILPEVDPAAFSGSIVTAGSSTVFPLSEAMAQRFTDEGFAGEVTIDSIGTGGGFERFCQTGETDIANASRAIKDSEAESCVAINRNPVAFRVGTDALAIVVSAENDFLTDVTLDDLNKIFSSTAVKWSDVNPAWPNEDILRFSPGTDSGTFDYFVEVVKGPAFKNAEGKVDTEAAEGDMLNAANIQFSEDDNVLVQGVEGSKYAIGYFGFAYYNENQGALKALSVEGVAPDAVSAEDGTYKIARPLFIYSDAEVIKNKPQVGAFINFFLTYVNEEISAVGYFPASDAALDEARTALSEILK